jgi:hypothetical protein
MLSAVEFIQAGLTQLHKNMDKAIADLTPEQLHAVPAGHAKANTIAFGLWHYVRTEDNVVRYVIQNRRPTVWAEGGYAEKLGLPPAAQGTGMPTADAQAFRIKDVALFKEYMGKVWASTDELFQHGDAAVLEKIVMVKPLGEMPAIRALGNVCLTHGSAHFGEIELARTLVGAGPAVGI